MTKEHKIYTMPVSDVYPHYVNKVERKGQSKEDLDRIITWLTGYSQAELEEKLDQNTHFRDFFDQAPNLNPNRDKITGVICGVRVEEIEEPLMQEIRYMDKLVDELARGKKIENILR